jgi:hypothetical protein
MCSVTLLSCVGCQFPTSFEASRSAAPPLYLQAAEISFKSISRVSAAQGLPPPPQLLSPSPNRS